MSRHYYAEYQYNYHTSGIYRFDSKSERDHECSPYCWTSNERMVRISAKDAMRKARELWNIRDYERFFGELIWVGGWSPILGTPVETVTLITH